MNDAMQPRDRWIPWYFVIFFVVLIAVDGTMATIAVRTNPGTVTQHPYESGLAYNKVVEAANAQKKLGWTGDVDFKNGTLTFSLRDAVQHAVIPDSVHVSFIRPSQSGMDFEADLLPDGNGHFALTPQFSAKGLWEVRVYATLKNSHYQQPKRSVVE